MYFAPDPKKPYLVIWGIERSGTNWLEILLKKNLDINVTSHKKHEPRLVIDSKFGPDAKFITIIKNPWAWCYSNAVKYAREVRPRFNKARRPLRKFQDRLLYYYNYNNETYIDRIKENPDRAILITYDDMLIDGYSKVIKRLSDYLSIPLKQDSIEGLKKIVGPNMDIKGQDFKQDFYLKQKYLDELSDSQIVWIKNNVSQKIMDYCNFKLIPDQFC